MGFWQQIIPSRDALNVKRLWDQMQAGCKLTGIATCCRRSHEAPHSPTLPRHLLRRALLLPGPDRRVKASSPQLQL